MEMCISESKLRLCDALSWTVLVVSWLPANNLNRCWVTKSVVTDKSFITSKEEEEEEALSYCV